MVWYGMKDKFYLSGEFKDIPGPYSRSGMLPDERHHIHQLMYSFRINRYRIMTLTYRGCKYSKEEQAKKDRDWWNLAHRPWLRLTYRHVGYMPFHIGGLIK